MSRTFTSRPGVQTRGRGASASRGVATRGRGHILGDSMSISERPARDGVTANNALGRGRARSRRMDGPGRNQFSADRDGGEEVNRDNEPDNTTGHYAGGYTVFSPNQTKREKINRMAERETAAYEEFKKANANKTYSYVGTVGGGETSEVQARNRQAYAVRTQKYNRLMRQTEHREKRKTAEEKEIEEKRANARKQAELNAARASREAPPDEIRRKREAFLRQLESKSSPPESSSATVSPHSQNESSVNKKTQFHKTSSTPSCPEVGKVRHTSLAQGTSSSMRIPEGKVSSESATNSTTGITRKGDTSDQSHKNSSNLPSKPRMATQAAPVPETDSNSDLTFLTSMYPKADRDSLEALLIQLGSVEAVIGAMNFE